MIAGDKQVRQALKEAAEHQKVVIWLVGVTVVVNTWVKLNVILCGKSTHKSKKECGQYLDLTSGSQHYHMHFLVAWCGWWSQT